MLLQEGFQLGLPEILLFCSGFGVCLEINLITVDNSRLGRLPGFGTGLLIGERLNNWVNHTQESARSSKGRSKARQGNYGKGDSMLLTWKLNM
jgi:hypothetical protein